MPARSFLAIKKHHIGFTLIEVMLAITILSIITLSSYKLIRTQIASLEQVNRHITKNKELFSGINTLERDFNQALMITSTTNTHAKSTILPLTGDSSQVIFTREGLTNLTGEKKSELETIRYKFDIETNTFTREVIDLNTEPQVDDNPKNIKIIFNNIETVQIIYHNHENTPYTYWPTNDSTINVNTVIDSFTQENIESDSEQIQKNNQNYEAPRYIQFNFSSSINGEWEHIFILSKKVTDEEANEGASI